MNRRNSSPGDSDSDSACVEFAIQQPLKNPIDGRDKSQSAVSAEHLNNIDYAADYAKSMQVRDVIRNFEQESTRSQFIERAYRCRLLGDKISMFMFNSNEATVVLRDDCDVPANFDVERFADELSVRDASLLKVLKLTKKPTVKLTAQTVSPGDSIQTDGGSTIVTLGCFIYVGVNVYALTTAHNLNAKQAMWTVSPTESEPSFLVGCIHACILERNNGVDVALIQLNKPGEETGNITNMVNDAANHRAITLVDVHTYNAGRGERLRKFSNGVDGLASGTVTCESYYANIQQDDGTLEIFRDCICVQPNADHLGFTKDGGSGTLLTTLPDGNGQVTGVGIVVGRVEAQALEVNAPCAARAHPIDMKFSVVQKLSRILVRLKMQPGWESLQVVKVPQASVACATATPPPATPCVPVQASSIVSVVSKSAKTGTVSHCSFADNNQCRGMKFLNSICRF